MGLISYIVFKKFFSRQEERDINDLSIDKITAKLMQPDFKGYLLIQRENRIKLNNYPFKELNIKSDDGVELVGYLYRNNNSNKTAVLVHGYGSSAYQGCPTTALNLIDKGYNILMFDNRACGKSEGEYTTFGIKESSDALLWIKYLIDIYPEDEIFIHGVSLGGATVCMMSNLDLPKNVKCIVSDCAYESLRGQMEYMTKGIYHMPKYPLLENVNKIFMKKTGLNFEMASPINSVKNAKVPMLFVHGDKDFYIPISNMEDLFKNCGNVKEKLVAKGAGHGSSMRFQEKLYFDTMYNFLDKYLK